MLAPLQGIAQMVTCAVVAWGKCILENDSYPGWQLPKIIQDSGFEIVPLATGRAEVLIAIDITQSTLLKVASFKSSAKLLMALEPPSASPFQHSVISSLLFDKIFKQSKVQVQRKKDMLCDAGYLPSKRRVNYELQKSELVKDRTRDLVLANSLKFAFGRSAQYHTRLDAIRGFAARGHKVHIAGVGWTDSLVTQILRSMRAMANDLSGLSIPRQNKVRIMDWKAEDNVVLLGRVPDEIETFRGYKFVLAIENDFSYVSEKFFNPILAGSLPIYSGGAASHGAPAASYLNLLDSSIDEVSEQIATMSEAEFSDRVSEGRSWILDPNTLDRWGHNPAFRRSVAALHEQSLLLLESRK